METARRENCSVCMNMRNTLDMISRRVTFLESYLIGGTPASSSSNAIVAPSTPPASDNAAAMAAMLPLDLMTTPIVTESSSIANNGDIRVGRTDLDPILLPYLNKSPYVGDDLERIVTECQRTFPHSSRSALNQLVREWFRKRREYMTHRVYNHCNKQYRMRDGKEVLKSLRGNAQALDEIREECRLDVTDVNAARDFAYDRVESFFERRKTK